LAIFASFSRFIASWAMSATWPVEAPRSRYYGPGSGTWLVASCRLVAVLWTDSDPQRPSTGSIWRPVLHVQLGTWGFVRWMGPLQQVGVNPGSSNREETRFLEVLCAFPFPIPHSTKPRCMKRGIKKAIAPRRQGHVI
jgi:hypothetical protein